MLNGKTNNTENTILPSRNKNVDILRAFALLWMVAYHAWVVCGGVPFRFSFLTLLVKVGGEMGVTGFFLLSGYSIYCSLHKGEMNGNIKFFLFIKKRLSRICPQYYFALLIALLFTSSAAYLQQGHVWNIICHVLFIHNWFLSYSGAINGVLWTMGVIFQFYLIAIPLYKLMSRNGILFGIIGIGFTICSKIFAYAWLAPKLQPAELLLFFLGRQLPTSLDNFLIGMLVAFLIYEKKKKIANIPAWAGCILAFAALVGLSKVGMENGICHNDILGYTWYSMVALLMGVILFCFFFIKINHGNIVSKIFLWVADNEYGTYIWHLIMFNNLLVSAPFIMSLLGEGHYKMVYVILIVLALVIGCLFTQVEKGLRQVFRF